MNRGWQENTGTDFQKNSFYLMEDINTGWRKTSIERSLLWDEAQQQKKGEETTYAKVESWNVLI